MQPKITVRPLSEPNIIMEISDATTTVYYLSTKQNLVGAPRKFGPWKHSG